MRRCTAAAVGTGGRRPLRIGLCGGGNRPQCTDKLGIRVARRTDPDPETPKEWALSYAERGYSVFPVCEAVPADGGYRCACSLGAACPQIGKHPRTQHGFHDASTDEAQIRRWWTQWPNANIGIRTGNGYAVLDVDVDKGGDYSLELLEAKHGKLPETRQAVSGSGGSHHWFRLPEGVQLASCNGFRPGLDIRSDGGYVVVEPSIHRSGNTYRWDGLLGFDAPVADIPEGLLNLLTARCDDNGAGGEPWRQVDVIVNRRPEVSPELVEYIESDSELGKLWNLRRQDFANPKTGEPNFSRYDLGLASHFVRAGLPHQTVADIITAFRLKHGNPKGKGYRRDYLQRTIWMASKDASVTVTVVDPIHEEGDDREHGAENPAPGPGVDDAAGVNPDMEAPTPEGEAALSSVRGDQGAEERKSERDCQMPADEESPASEVKATGDHNQNVDESGGDAAAEEPKSESSDPTEKVPSMADWLISEVKNTGDLNLVYQHVDLLAALPDSQLAVAYEALRAVLGLKLDPGVFQVAIKKAREALHRQIYREHYGGIGRIKVAKDGTETMIPLTNFAARITANIGEDDGVEMKRFFGIDAQLAYKPYKLIVPASKFGGMEWAIEELGPTAIVYPNQKEWARAGIQSFSSRVVERRIYTHTGWRKVGGSMLYLHGDGAIGANGAVANVDVRLSGALAHYSLIVPENRGQLVEAVRASLRVLEVAPDHITIPAVSATYRASIKSCDFATWFGGPTGVFKSELAALAQQHYGAAMNARRLPGNFASTGNALEVLAFSAKDALLVIDDFARHGGVQDVNRYHAAADRILRAAGNNQGRGRLSSEARLREAKPPRGLVLATGEDMPRGQSIRGRTLIVEIAPGDVNTTVLTECQVAAASGMYARSMMEFAVDIEAITTYQKTALRERCWTALNQVARSQRVQQDASEPTRRFLELLRAAVLSGQAHLANLKGEAPGNDGQWGWYLVGSEGHERLVSRGKCIGWLDGPDLYLEPTASYGVAQELGRTTGEPLVVGQTTLKKRLKEKGLLASTDTARETLTVRRRVCGEYVPVIHLHGTVLGAPPEGGSEKDEVLGDPVESFTC